MTDGLIPKQKFPGLSVATGDIESRDFKKTGRIGWFFGSGRIFLTDELKQLK